VLASLVRVQGITRVDVGTVIDADDFLGMLFDELGIRVFEKFFIEAFDVLGDIALCGKLIGGVYLRTAALEIVGILYRIHDTNILN